MAGEHNEDVVEDIERVDISGNGGADEPAEGTTPEGEVPEGEGDGAAPEGDGLPPEQLVHNTPPAPVAPATAPAAPAAGAPGVPQKLPGESDREYALRLEVTNLRGQLSRNRASEITGEVVPAGTARREMTTEQKAILQKYEADPQNKAAIAAMREIFPVLAAEQGFVKADEIAKSEFERDATAQLDGFLDKHPEYLPANDPGNILWDRFRSTYAMYRPPTTPRAMAQLLDRVHREVFGIQAPGALPGVAAAQRKADIASHAGAPASPARPSQPRAAAPATGVRFDMLKGFSQEDIDEMKGE